MTAAILTPADGEHSVIIGGEAIPAARVRPSDINRLAADPEGLLEIQGWTADELVGLSPWALAAYVQAVGKEYAVGFLDFCDEEEHRGRLSETERKTFWPLNDAIFGHRATGFLAGLDCSTADLIEWAAERTPLAWEHHIGGDLDLADALAAAYSDLAERIGDPLGQLKGARQDIERLALAIVRDQSEAGDMGKLEAGETPEADPPEPRFKLLSPDDLLTLPPLRWRVRGILPETGLAAIYGPAGSGKSFLVLDLLGAIAEGRPWFGRAVEPCPVCYVALEGEAGIAQRVRAYMARHGTPEGLRVILSPLDIRKVGDRAGLAEVIRGAGLAGGVLAIDTLSQSAPGADENSSVDMGGLIAALKDLQSSLGGLVVVLHHSGKDLLRGLRGHSSLLAALDAVIEVSRDGDRREWKVSKSKDGGDGESQSFRLAVVELDVDADGWPVTSCVVESEAPAAEAVGRARVPRGGNQKVMWDGLGELLRASHHFGQADAPPTRPCVKLDDAIAALRGRLPVTPDRQTERARQAIIGLIARGLIHHREGWLWCA